MKTKRIIIQHTDGKYYEYSRLVDKFEENFDDVKKYPDKCSFSPYNPTSYYNFPIGSRIYFQGIGWTEVKHENAYESCDNCAFYEKDDCIDDSIYNCPKNKTIFKKYEVAAKNEPAEEKAERYFVLSDSTGCILIEKYKSEEDARITAGLSAKNNVGHEYIVVKQIASCKAEASVKWSE